MELNEEVLDLFQAYDWPGNVRELKHCIDRLSIMHSEGALQMADLPSALQYQRSAAAIEQLSGALTLPRSPETLPTYRSVSPLPVISLPQSERHAIGCALAQTRGEKGRAARLLGIGRTTLYRKMKQYGME